MNRKGVSYDVGPVQGGDSVANCFAALLIRVVRVCGMDLPEPPADAADEAPDQGLPAAAPPAPAARGRPVGPAASPSAPRPVRRPPATQPPLQSREDTDAGWGERPEPDDDERLYRDRPPHWEK